MNAPNKNSKILDRIRKLLALANDDANANESQAAFLIAQRLMVEHNISVEQAQQEKPDAKADPVEVIKEAVFQAGRVEDWRKTLGVAISENFRCKISTQTGDAGAIFFWGHPNDVELAKAMYIMASMVAEKAADKFAKNYPNGKRREIKTAFRVGFATGLRDKFRKQREDNNWGLVVCAPAAVEEHFALATSTGFTKKSIGKGKRYHNGAFNAGEEEGENFARRNDTSEKPRTILRPKLLN